MATILKVDGTEQVLTDLELASLQKEVGGYIEAVRLLDGRLAFINEEGKLKGLPINERASLLYGRDEIVGAMVILTAEEERQQEQDDDEEDEA